MVFNGESADDPEDIVVDWSLRYPCLQMLHPESHFSMDDTVMHCHRCGFLRAHAI